MSSSKKKNEAELRVGGLCELRNNITKEVTFFSLSQRFSEALSACVFVLSLFFYAQKNPTHRYQTTNGASERHSSLFFIYMYNLFFALMSAQPYFCYTHNTTFVLLLSLVLE